MGAAMATMVSAEYKSMVFTTHDGTEHNIGLDGLEIEFQGTKMYASDLTTSLEFDLASLASMQFSEKLISDVEAVIAEGGEVEIFTLGGEYLGKYENLNAALARFNDAGIYIAKFKDGYTIKITKR